MKTQFNITSMKWDLERYTSVEDFTTALEGFDGVELMDYGDDISPIIPEEKVIGIHMRCPYHWLDFWKGDMERCIREYGSEKQVYENFGGTDRQALVDAFLQDWNRALLHQAEYAVYHISDVTCMECLTGEYAHTDEEVIDAACELINQALPATAEDPWLLLEKPVASGTDVYPAGDDQTAAGRNSLSENRIYAGHRSSDAYGSGAELPGGGGLIYPPVSGSAR